jgi:hypothetical protein
MQKHGDVTDMLKERQAAHCDKCGAEAGIMLEKEGGKVDGTKS